MLQHGFVFVEILALVAGLVALFWWLWYEYKSSTTIGCQSENSDTDTAVTAVTEQAQPPEPRREVQVMIDPMTPSTPAKSDDAAVSSGTRCRLRDLGLRPGVLPTGPNNAITDAGVLVGHCTVSHGDGALVPGRGPARTGVTVVIPHKGDLWTHRPSAGFFVLNGNGCVTGLDWINEAGLFEGPIGLTNTHSIGDVYRSIICWMQDKYPAIGITDDTTMPVVAECDDSALNDIRGFHVGERHVKEALDTASDGKVAEGSVGAGTGMTSFQFKGGIGTSSRVVRVGDKDYTVGVLVNCNHAKRPQLQIMGVPVGHVLEKEQLSTKSTEGSIVIIVATDAPLSPRQCARLARRAALGLGLTGATANTTSGDFVIAFSNSRLIPRETEEVLALPELSDGGMNPLFMGTVEATSEAIWNALCMAETVVGRDGNTSPAMPLDRVRSLFIERGMLAETS
jgi:D-aminopeptidase